MLVSCVEHSSAVISRHRCVCGCVRARGHEVNFLVEKSFLRRTVGGKGLK